MWMAHAGKVRGVPYPEALQSCRQGTGSSAW